MMAAKIPEIFLKYLLTSPKDMSNSPLLHPFLLSSLTVRFPNLIPLDLPQNMPQTPLTRLVF